MNLIKSIALIAVTAATLSGCGYAGVAVENGQAVVLRNDGLLFGLLRKAFVCKVADTGLSDCQSDDAP